MKGENPLMSYNSLKASPVVARSRLTVNTRLRVFRRSLGPYFFVLPALLFLVIFLLYPIFTTLLFSFEQVDVGGLMTGDTPFVGLQNYHNVLTDKVFLSSLSVSLIFTAACIVFQYSLGFLLALLFNNRFPLVGLMRASVLVAWMLPVVVSGTIFKWMLQTDSGIVNYVLSVLGLIHVPLHWLTDTKLALWGPIIANIWIGIPFNMTILLAGLQGISPALYEAAAVDGANGFQRFLYITIPQMRASSLIVLTLGVIYTLNVFDLIYIMTGGGPVNATEVLPLYAYQISFNQFDLGGGAAVAVLMLLFLLAVSAVYLLLIRNEDAS
jgi:multiple sugar transport system permease protein